MFQRFIHPIRNSTNTRLFVSAFATFWGLSFAVCGGGNVSQPSPVKDSALATIKAHSAPVSSVLFTPDGKQIISAGRDGRLVLWDVAAKTAVLELLPKGDQIRATAISADGKYLAAGNEKGVVNVFDLDNRRLLRQISAGNDAILALGFDSKGKFLATGGKDKQVKVWDLGGGDSAKQFEGSFDRIDSIAFSPDDKQIFAGSSGTGIRTWRLSDAKPQDSRFQYNGEIYSITADKARSLILAAGTAGDVKGLHDGRVKIWNYSDGKELLSFVPHRLVTSSVSVSNQTLATASTTDAVVRLWDLNSGNPVGTFTGHTKGVNSVCFSPDGNLLASGGEDGTVKIWNVPHH